MEFKPYSDRYKLAIKEYKKTHKVSSNASKNITRCIKGIKNKINQPVTRFTQKLRNFFNPSQRVVPLERTFISYIGKVDNSSPKVTPNIDKKTIKNIKIKDASLSLNAPNKPPLIECLTKILKEKPIAVVVLSPTTVFETHGYSSFFNVGKVQNFAELKIKLLRTAPVKTMDNLIVDSYSMTVNNTEQKFIAPMIHITNCSGVSDSEVGTNQKFVQYLSEVIRNRENLSLDSYQHSYIEPRERPSSNNIIFFSLDKKPPN
ncbi:MULTISPECIES: hypothetical protein [Providencia]|uniref:hypothetical protein n=1 Tax=Providencia TaxID=586 RepID=UPI001B370751|nr:MULTISPECIES: hypothetical protein [Providencia]MBQ0534948.1 hypothetical protein [Providencia huaxiensis]MBQ0590086.1 hypothetical protein [Providencia huaxiensis]MDI7241383.1 hypothetical protein [Providencia huaxiensis]